MRPTALILTVLACAALPAGATPDDDAEVTKDRSPAVCFALIGKGRERTGLSHLAKQDPRVAAAAAATLLASSREPSEVAGAGIYLGAPAAKKAAGSTVGAVVRKRWEEVGAQRKAKLAARDAAKQALVDGARVRSPAQVKVLKAKLRDAEAALRGVSELWEALTVALGAVGTTRDLIELSWLVRRGAGVEVRASARGLCASHDPFGGFHQLLRTLDSVLERVKDDREERAEAGEAARAATPAMQRLTEVLKVFREHLARSARAGALIGAIASQERDAAVLETLLVVRRRSDRRAVGELARDYCQSDEPAARAVAMRLLARTRDEEAVPLLVQGLADRESEVRLAAAEAFARLGRKRARGSLSKLVPLLGESSTPVRKAAHRALVVLSGKRIALSQVAWARYFKAQERAVR